MQLEKHPDKTFIGPVARGFDFLGFHFDANGVKVSRTTLHRFFTKLIRLYEQSPATPEGVARVRTYVNRWLRWVVSRCPLFHVTLCPPPVAFDASWHTRL